MKRRKFLQTGLTGGLLPLMLNGFSVRALADNPLLSFLGKAGNSDRVLVLIQLNGGNDGLNTVIPIDQYDNLNNARGNIILAKNKILALTGTDKTGLHAGMDELRGMYDNGRVAIIQSVGYPNPDFSHFRSTDIWLTASESNQFLEEGWMGRYLDTQYPGFPAGYPNATYPDPPAIQIGAMVSPALQGQDGSFGMSISDPNSFYQFVSGTVDPAPNTPAGHELTFIRLVTQQTQQYSASVKSAAQKATNLSTLYPAKGVNTLSDQLKIVAQLIAGGLKTKVYMVSLGGFDNHSAQVVSGATETGTHANLLSKISIAVNAFQDDLQKLGVSDRVLGMTFSEFGRRIKSNASLGTDHGAAAPMFLFGEKVNGGCYGNNPTIAQSVGVNDNIPMQHDFRSIYATILKNWFEVNDTQLSTVMLKSFPILPFVNGATGTDEQSAFNTESISAFPNPCRENTTLTFVSTGGLIRVRLFNSEGREVRVLAEGNFPKGACHLPVSTDGLAPGLYYYQLQMGSDQCMKNLMVY